MEDLLAVLCDIENRAWKAADTRDAGFYREYLAPEALIVTPFGVLNREEIIREIAENPLELPAYALSDERVVPLGEENAVLVYTVSLGGHTLYVSTVYARNKGRWRAAFHQRTPAVQEVGGMD
ncbi:nuclear transport factor 2 family protein [Methanoculleus caldifontis]|nr:nuclear transport factor 2 family protein [Methanoculleus sp. Wushi-C6]